MLLINTYLNSHTENPSSYRGKIDYDILNVGKSYTELLLFDKPSSIKKAPILGYSAITNAKFSSLPEDLFEVEGSDQNNGYDFSIRNTNYYSIIKFLDCNYLKTIPENILKPLKNIKESIIFFENCNAIENIPENLFRHNAKLSTLNDGLFKNCLGIRHIPTNLLNGKNIQSLYNLFTGCVNADNYNSLPAGWK
jgi:hypothetical protein